MKEVIQDVDKIIKFTKSTPNNWTTLTDQRKGKICDGIAICHNHAVMCFELLNYYKQIWCNNFNQSPEKIERARRENGERVIESTKGMFLFCFSAIEFSMKHALRINSLPLDEFSNRIKLGDLFRKYLKKQLIDQNEYDLWDGAISIRNSIVHNNGIWEDSNKTIEYPNGHSINLKEGAMVQGNLQIFSLLTNWIINAYIKWATTLMSVE